MFPTSLKKAQQFVRLTSLSHKGMFFQFRNLLNACIFFFNISDVSDVKLVAGGAIVIFCVTVGEDSLAMMTQDNVFVGTKLYATKPVSTQNHEDKKKMCYS